MKAWLRKLFIPTLGNGYAPHSLERAAVGGMLVLVLLSFTLVNMQSLLWVSSDWLVSAILPAVIVTETNKERVSESLGVLHRSAVLDAAAQMKANDMAKNQYFAHYSPTGVSPWYWFDQANYNFVHAGENLAIHFTDSGEIVDAWMDSPTHRANIMNGNYVEIGIGTAEGTYDGFSTVYVVQLFGTPAVGAPKVAGEEMKVVAVSPAASAVPAVAMAPVATSVKPQAPEETTIVLADKASISQTTEIIPAEPVLVSDSSTSPEASTTVVEDTVVTDSGVMLYSDFVSTSTGGISAMIDPLLPNDGESIPKAFSILTQPHFVLQLMYAIIGLFVLVSLLLSIFIEIRRQQPLQIMYGCVLLVLMSGLFYVHTVLTSGALIV